MTGLQLSEAQIISNQGDLVRQKKMLTGNFLQDLTVPKFPTDSFSNATWRLKLGGFERR